MPMPKRAPSCTDRLAINLYDLMRVDEFIRAQLVGGKINLDRAAVIKVDPDRLDETAVEFTCGIVTAACIADTIRTHDRAAKQYPSRVYLRRATAWNRLPAEATLALVEDGKVLLNPKVFKVELPVAKPKARGPQRVEF